MVRLKDVLGDGLRSHIHERQATGVEVVVHVLNRMFELGCGFRRSRPGIPNVFRAPF